VAVVLFVLEKIPRTVGREEWYNIWRKVRRMRTEQKELDERICRLLPSMPTKIRQAEIDRIVNPPLLLGPYMESVRW
jgi:hypothetical protein